MAIHELHFHKFKPTVTTWHNSKYRGFIDQQTDIESKVQLQKASKEMPVTEYIQGKFEQTSLMLIRVWEKGSQSQAGTSLQAADSSSESSKCNKLQHQSREPFNHIQCYNLFY